MAEIEIIKPDSIIKIGISETYYKNLQELTLYYSKLVPVEELSLQVDNIKEDKLLSEWGHHFKTLLTLINEIEYQAKEQKMTELVEVSLPTVD
jgi:hypothetical protein